jgi:hypothetical protein
LTQYIHRLYKYYTKKRIIRELGRTDGLTTIDFNLYGDKKIFSIKAVGITKEMRLLCILEE